MFFEAVSIKRQRKLTVLCSDARQGQSAGEEVNLVEEWHYPCDARKGEKFYISHGSIPLAFFFDTPKNLPSIHP